jgi:hypothetical protein
MFLSRSGSIFLLLRVVTAAATGVGILAKAMGSSSSPTGRPIDETLNLNRP